MVISLTKSNTFRKDSNNTAMKTLTIFYDPRCGMCSTFRQWLMRQVKTVYVEFVDYAGDEARRRFPGIEDLRADQDIVVLADDGRWWQGASAWLVCLWTTVEYRGWSYRFAGENLKPLVKRFVHALSTRRHAISNLLGLKCEAQLLQELQSMGEGECATGRCSITPTSPPALPQNVLARQVAKRAMAQQNQL